MPPWQTSPVGPFDAWPSGGGGFEYFYGFIGGENNQYYPALYEGTNPVEPEKTPEEGYHLTEDLTDRAIDWVRTQKALAPDKPFFVYFAPGATHAPHHVAAGVVGQVRRQVRRRAGTPQRESIFARQQALGVVAPDAELTPRPDAIPAWDDMDPALKPVLERADGGLRGLPRAHRLPRRPPRSTRSSRSARSRTRSSTTSSATTGPRPRARVNGAFNEMANFNGMAAIETPEFMASVKDKLGTVDAYNHYSVGWAWAMCAPYPVDQAGRLALGRHAQRDDRALAGRHQQPRARPRSQFTHVIDVAPTILEAAGLPEPTFVNGVQQAPIEGTSMVYSFDAADAPERHDLQYFEMFGNRGIYHQGWSAVTRHSTPWLPAEVLPPLDEDVWELYDGSSDRTQANDLAAEMPDKLAALQRLWLIEAVKYNVLPIDDRRFERLNPTLAGRPQLITGNRQVLFPGMKRLTEHSVIDVKNRSFTRHRVARTPPAGKVTSGVIIAQGGRFGGWALYVRDGRAKFVYNVLGIQEFEIAATEPIPAGSHQVRAEFAYDGGGLAKGGTVTLYYDGRAVGTGRVDLTQPMIFSADETTDIGDDFGMPVSADYGGSSRFNGRIDVVEIDVGDDDQSHLIDPEDVARVAISRQ